VRLKHDSEETVETGTYITSLARMDMMGDVNLCSCHQLKMSKSSSKQVIVSLSK